MKNIQRTLVLGCSLVALAGCGADEIVSPGTSGDIIINDMSDNSVNDSNNVTNAPPASPPASSGLVTPAASCPGIASTGGLTDQGTITGPTGEYRVCEVPQLFDTDDALPFVAGVLYAFSGRVDVGTDQGFDSTGTAVTLTIDPGVILYAATGQAFFNVNRGNELDADGTASAPIIFTSRDNVIGVATDESDNQWGGVTLLGRAPVSDCGNSATGVLPDGEDCEQLLEGIAENIPFGGTDNGDSSGSLSFVQIRYSGFTFASGSELQSLTAGGIGDGTNLQNIQSFNSGDDGLEFFGGVVNIDTTAIIGAGDDSLDVDTGSIAAVQNVLIAQRVTSEADVGDTSIELDSPSEDFTTTVTPQTVLNVSNFTFIQTSGTDEVVNLRGGAQINLVNGVIQANGAECFAFNEQVSIDAGSTFNSIVAECPADAVATLDGDDSPNVADAEAVVNAGSNNTFNATITFANDFFFDASGTTVTDPTSLSSFFSTTDFVGAISSAADTRFQGWTCDSATIDFGSGNNCSSLPIRQGEG
ncbi:MAG: hypothetical protein AAFR88_03590 [Pseudomonadota bacterium]